MFVVQFGNSAINLSSIREMMVCSESCSTGRDMYYISCIDTKGLETFLGDFETIEEANKLFEEILTAYSNNVKVFRIS